jgi:hypothetical protein
LTHNESVGAGNCQSPINEETHGGHTMNILKNKQNRSGIISLIFLLLSFVINLINAFAFGGYSVILVLSESLSRILAFVFAVIGIVKALKNKKGFLICVPGLALPLLHFCVSFAVFFAEIRPLLNYTDEYVYDINKNKIEYRLGRGFLEYNRHDIFSWIPYIGADGNYYYTVYLSGLNGERLPLPYCYWLNLYEGNPMIGLSEFCDYYHYHIEEDENNHRTIIYQLNDRLILPWGKYKAYYEKSGETISLKYPVVHIKTGCNISEDGTDTFVDTDFLYYAGFLKLFDEKACEDFYDYLGTKWDVIKKNGEEINGEYYYKGNKISGAALYFYNNELFEDSVVKIGMSADEVAAILGPSFMTNLKNHLNYWWFDMYYDEDNQIELIHLCYD